MCSFLPKLVRFRASSVSRLSGIVLGLLLLVCPLPEDGFARLTSVAALPVGTRARGSIRRLGRVAAAALPPAGGVRTSAGGPPASKSRWHEASINATAALAVEFMRCRRHNAVSVQQRRTLASVQANEIPPASQQPSPSSLAPSPPSSAFLRSLPPSDRAVLLSLLSLRRLRLRHRSEALVAHSQLRAALSRAARTAREGGGGGVGSRGQALMRRWAQREAQVVAAWLVRSVGGGEGAGPGSQEEGLEASSSSDEQEEDLPWSQGPTQSLSFEWGEESGDRSAAAGSLSGRSGGKGGPQHSGQQSAGSHPFCRSRSAGRGQAWRGRAGEGLLAGGAALPPPVAWQPAPDRLLLAYCSYGRTSNRLLCLQNLLLLAALLNRTLVVASEMVLGDLGRLEPLFNASHLNWCLQRRRAEGLGGGQAAGEQSPPDFVLTLEEWVQKTGGKTNGPLHVKVDKCFGCPGGTTFTAAKSASEEPFAVVTTRRAERRPLIAPSLPAVASTGALKGVAAGRGPRMVCLRDQFYFSWAVKDIPAAWGFEAGLTGAWLGQDHGLDWNMRQLGWGAAREDAQEEQDMKQSSPDMDWTSSSFCRYALWPPQPVLLVARAVVGELMGPRFIAVHMRRRDFFPGCVLEKRCPYWAQLQAARCVAARLLAADILEAVAAHAGAGGGGLAAEKTGGRMPAVFVASDVEDGQLETFTSALRREAARMWASVRAVSSTAERRRLARRWLEEHSEEPGEAAHAPMRGAERSEVTESDGEELHVVRLPPDLYSFAKGVQLAERFSAQEKQWLGESSTRAIVEKLVCAQASVFLGLPSSTFSMSIMGMREAMGTANCLDGAMCRGITGSEEWR